MKSVVATGDGAHPHPHRVVVDEVYPLPRIAEAVAHSEGGHARGKVIVTL